MREITAEELIAKHIGFSHDEKLDWVDKWFRLLVVETEMFSTMDKTTIKLPKDHESVRTRLAEPICVIDGNEKTVAVITEYLSWHNKVTGNTIVVGVNAEAKSDLGIDTVLVVFIDRAIGKEELTTMLASPADYNNVIKLIYTTSIPGLMFASGNYVRNINFLTGDIVLNASSFTLH